MRRIIAVMLAVVLVVSGLGSVAYAQEDDPVNEVEARFVTALSYLPVGPEHDTFTNGDEISLFWKDWEAKMGNSPDGTGADVTALTLALDSEVPFNTVRNLENLTQMDPPIYEWFFGDVPEGYVEQAKGAVQLMGEWYQPYGPEPPITFTPGFDASRSVDKAEFFQSDGMQTQVLTVTLTPREQERTEGLDIHLGFDENDLVKAVITSWSGGEGDIELFPDGKLGIRPTGLVINHTWSIDVTLLVTPKKPKVYFIPYIQVGWNETITSGTTITTSGSSFSYPAGDDPAEEPGTWTWSAEGSYRWNWVQELRTAVHWFPRCREIVEPTPQELKAGTIDKLEQLLAEDIGDDDLLQAIDYIHMSLGDERGRELGSEVIWLDAYHIDRIKGADVFQYEEEAADKLEAYLLNEENAGFGFEEAINEVGDNLYHADRQLAEVAINEAIAGGGNPDDIAEAEEYMQLAEERYEAGVKLSAVLDLLEEAWEKVVYSHPPILRLQTWLAPDDPLMQPLQNFAQAVNKKSDSVRIVLYSAAAPVVPIGELAEAVKQGTVEMGLIYSHLLRDYSRVLDAGWLPFLYNDNDGLMAAVQAGIADLLSDELTGHNITALTWTTTGFSHLYSRTKMLAHPDDITQDVKIRVVGGIGGAHEGMQWEAMTEWGGEPITLPFAEIYWALEEEFIEGAMHSPYTYEVMKFYEVAPYFCVDYAFANLVGLCINSDVWNSLDAKTKDIITKAAGNYVNEMMATVKQLDAEALATIEGYGVTVYTLTPGKRLVWREASQPVWDGWVSAVGKDGEDIIAIALEHNPLP